ncbi:MAG: hypothetical protein V4645_27885 [Pseudomonadota bacterium]
MHGPKADASVVLSSDAQVMNAWWMEIDPAITGYQIEKLSPSDRAKFDVNIVLADGSRQMRDITSFDEKPSSESEKSGYGDRAQLAALLGGTYVLVGPAVLREYECLIENGKIAVATMAAARHHSIEVQHANLLALMMRQSAWTVAGLLQHIDVAEQALFLAAVFRAISRGEVQADLNQRRWGGSTRIWLGSSSNSGEGLGRPRDKGAPDDVNEDERPQVQSLDQQSRALRTADAAAAMASALQRAEAGSPTSYTRKNIPAEYKDPNRWPAVHLDPEKRPDEAARAIRLRAAICGYLEGAPLRMLEEANKISRAEILRLFNRALQQHPDGGIYGWRVLLFGFHLGYERKAPVVPDEFGKGFAGALNQLFARFTDIPRSLVELILHRTDPKTTESRVTAHTVHSAFLKLCASHGVPQHEYPFNSPTQGFRSIRRFVKKVREENFARSAEILGGRGAAKRSKLYSGHEVLLRHPRPFDAVQQDAHTLDVIGSVRIPHPKGDRRIPIKRLALQVIVECESKAVLGYSVSLSGRANAQDGAAAVQHALGIWRPLQVDAPIISYPDGAGLPSGVIPKLAGAAWSTHYLDNDSTYTSALLAERIRDRIGCAVNWGPVGDWTRRYIVEGVFGVLEKAGFQRLPSTTGSGPKDPRRRNAERKAVEHEVDYKELIYLIDVALATYDATSLADLGYRSPLQLLRERTQGCHSDFLPRRLPSLYQSVPEMHIETAHVFVRGNMAQGRRPSISLDGVLHTSQLLAECAVLIGKRIVVHIDNDDLRQVIAFTEDGRPLGPLTAQSGWNRIVHTRQMRKQINMLRNSHELLRRPGQDWVEAYLESKTQQAAQAAATGKLKVSKAATVVADIAHRSGQDVPVVPDPAASPPAPERVTRPVVVPMYLKRPLRRALL